MPGGRRFRFKRVIETPSNEAVSEMKNEANQ
jgi:hypothetical protein